MIDCQPELNLNELTILSGQNVHGPLTGLPWLWKPYLAYGAVSILDGDPGVGKSLITIDIAARLSTFRPMPDGSPPAENPNRKDRVPPSVFISGDDGTRCTILPRFLAAGGQSGALIFLGGVDENDLSKRPMIFPKDLNALAAVLAPKASGGGAFVVIDPISAIYPKAVAGSDAAVREAIDPLIRLAAWTRSCFLLVRHLNKSGGRRSIYRGGGSIGIVGACRTALLAGTHPDDPRRRVLSMTKGNLGPPGPSLAYRIETVPERAGHLTLQPGAEHPETRKKLKEPLRIERTIPAGPAIVWDGPTTITADDLVSVRPDLGAQSARAAEWLKKLLANGPVPATVVEAQAYAEGLGYTTVRAMKVKLNIESQRVMVDGVARWEWMLPRPKEEPTNAAPISSDLLKRLGEMPSLEPLSPLDRP